MHRGRGAGRARVRDRAGPPRPARAHGREHRRAREGRSAGRALPLGRGREPPRVPRAVPRPPGCRLPVPRARHKGTGRLPHLAPGVHPSHAAHDAQRRELRSVLVRDRALVGRASHGAGGERLHGLPGREPAGGWAAGCGRPDRGDRPGSRGAAALELHGAERSHRQGDGAGRGDEGKPVAGVARVAGRAVRESADLRARRERDLGDQAAARCDRPHARLAGPHRCLRWQLHVPTRSG